jgi:hypothetical protein
MGRKVRFSALHRTAPRLARDFSDSFRRGILGSSPLTIVELLDPQPGGLCEGLLGDKFDGVEA